MLLRISQYLYFKDIHYPIWIIPYDDNNNVSWTPAEMYVGATKTKGFPLKLSTGHMQEKHMHTIQTHIKHHTLIGFLLIF